MIRTSAALLSTLVATVLLTACYPHWGPINYSAARLWAENPLPRSEVGDPPILRLGGLPHPFLMIPVRITDPNRLGRHDYVSLPLAPLRFAERSGGIVYTRRGGFLDIAHLRNTSDRVWYAHEAIRQALRAQRREVVLVFSDPSFFHVEFEQAITRDTMSDSARSRRDDELAIRLAQHVAFYASTWHEVLTFGGYRSVLLVPERQSAFAWDDQPSHMVGALAAGEALSSGGDFEESLTAILEQWMAELEAQPPNATRDAIAAVEGLWWGGERTRRFVHLGVGPEPMIPLLVPDDPQDAAARWRLPDFEDVAGHDMTGCCRIRIDPRSRAAKALYEGLETEPRMIDPAEDFPRLQEMIRAESAR